MWVKAAKHFGEDQEGGEREFGLATLSFFYSPRISFKCKGHILPDGVGLEEHLAQRQHLWLQWRRPNLTPGRENDIKVKHQSITHRQFCCYDLLAKVCSSIW